MAEYIEREELLKRLDMAIDCKNCPRCVDMKTYYDRCAYTDIQDVCGVISNIPTAYVQPVDRWINAQTNPPIATDGKTSDYVLVLRKSGYQCVCYYVYDEEGNYWVAEDEKSMYEVDEITRWQPLPEPPKTTE